MPYARCPRVEKSDIHAIPNQEKHFTQKTNYWQPYIIRTVISRSLHGVLSKHPLMKTVQYLINATWHHHRTDTTYRNPPVLKSFSHL